MRLSLKLKVISDRKISPNYHYALSAAIYKLLRFGSSEFSQFLHDTGYVLEGKRYKLFTFSLRLPKIKPSSNFLLLESSTAYLYVTSPIEEDFIKNFLIGTLEEQTIEITANNIFTEFSIQEAELLPEPSFTQGMKFVMWSPLVLSKQIERNGEMAEYYFRWNDDIKEIQNNFENNLISKYKLITQKEYKGKGITLTWDNNYIRNRIDRGKRPQKRILINKDLNNPISIIGMEAPFYLKGDVSLMKIAYECGCGKHNAMGFGMIEKAKPDLD